jgi:hypothetical protein
VDGILDQETQSIERLPLTRAVGSAFLLFLVPVVAVAGFCPAAWSSLVGATYAVAPASRPQAMAPQDKMVLESGTDTATVTPNALSEAATVLKLYDQNVAALQSLTNQQTDPVKNGTLGIETTALQGAMQSFTTSVIGNPKAPNGLTPYGLAHADSAALHQQINLLRQGIHQITNTFALTLLEQQLNLAYQEATVLDSTYRKLTAARTNPTTLFNTLVAFDQAVALATAGAFTAQQQEVATGNLLAVNASPFTFSGSGSTQP